MSKPTSRTKRKPHHRRPAKRRTSDRAIYFGLLVIGVFAVLLAYLLTDGRYWKHAALAYATLVAFFVHRYGFAVYRGSPHLAGWQAALARVVLRPAGYGGSGGKPIEAAHDDPAVMKALIAGILVSVIVIGGLVAWQLI